MTGEKRFVLKTRKKHPKLHRPKRPPCDCHQKEYGDGYHSKFCASLGIDWEDLK